MELPASPGGLIGSLVGFLLILVASVEDFLEWLPDPLGGSFSDLSRAFSGADADVLAGSRGTFAEISAGFARVHGRKITSRSGGAFTQAPRPPWRCLYQRPHRPCPHHGPVRFQLSAFPCPVLHIPTCVIRPIRKRGFPEADFWPAGMCGQTLTSANDKSEPPGHDPVLAALSRYLVNAEIERKDNDNAQNERQH